VRTETAGARPPGATPAPTQPFVRDLLYVAALLVFLAGVQLFVFPLRTDRYFAWTIGSPMTATFLGASYWAAVGLEFSAARARWWADARIAVPAVLVFTTTTLVVTAIHLEVFHLGDEFELTTQLVTWAWIAVYAIVPMLMVVALLLQRRHRTVVPPPTGLPVLVRVVTAALAVLLIGLGAALLVAPEWADAAWPWALTPLTGRAIGAWLVGLGTGAAHALIIDDRPAIRPLGVTAVLFGILQFVALARHGDELDWNSPPAWVFVAVLVTLIALGAWTMVPSSRSGAEPAASRKPTVIDRSRREP
jgi:hypothetical protein